ncbi:Cullin-4A, partial [Coemansia sp. RSA 2673]
RDVFEEFINSRRGKIAQLMTKYIDQCMRSSEQAASEEGIDGLLDRIIALFRYVHGKDLFEAYYRRDLAKRLINDKSASIDTEWSMLQKMRMECGSGYTKRLEGMLRDMADSGDLVKKFASSQQGREANTVGFHAVILTQAFWPTYEPLPLVIPREAERMQEQFVQFYNEKHNGRNLQWQPNLGTCLLKVEFDEGPKELTLTLIQATVLLLFSDCRELSYAQIQANTGLEDVEKETKEVEEHIQLDRMYRVDAAIMRILKARKQLEHTALMTELLGQLKFAISLAEVKERIDTLIERDYMKRDDANPSLYLYLA